MASRTLRVRTWSALALLSLAADAEGIAAQDAAAPEDTGDAGAAAYVMFTSGSDRSNFVHSSNLAPNIG